MNYLKFRPNDLVNAIKITCRAEIERRSRTLIEEYKEKLDEIAKQVAADVVVEFGASIASDEINISVLMPKAEEP